jgi:hypothetical protein
MNIRRAMIAAPLMPEFDRESGSRRIYDLICFLREAGWAVSFVAENGRGGERYAHALQQQGVAIYNGFGRQTEELIEHGRLDVALFAFWHLARAHIPTVRRLSPETRIIVDTIDLHFMRNARKSFQFGTTKLGQLDRAYGEEFIGEMNTYAAADAALTVSQKEADLLGDLCGDPSLAHVVADSEDLERGKLPFDKRDGIVFIGNFRHPPRSC